MSCANRHIPEADPERSRDVLEENVLLSLAKAYNHIHEHHLKLFKEFGITPQQYNVLRILHVRGANGLCNSEISDLMTTRVPDITRLIDRMERDQLLKRVRSEADRRMVSIFLLDKGREICTQLDTPLVEHSRSLLAHFTESEQQLLKQLLDKMVQLCPFS